MTMRMIILGVALAGAAAVAADTNVILRKVVSMHYSDEGGYTGNIVTNTVAVPIDWEMARTRIKIVARMKKKDKLVAMVGNQVVAVGDTARIEMNDLIYTWKLTALTADKDEWDPVSVVDGYRGGAR
jgi:hypothetical protein